MHDRLLNNKRHEKCITFLHVRLPIRTLKYIYLIKWRAAGQTDVVFKDNEAGFVQRTITQVLRCFWWLSYSTL